MNRLSLVLKKQRREIEKLKSETIAVYSGFGKEQILSFAFGGFRYSDGETDTQKKIDEGHYKSIEDFDSFHTSDIEFSCLYFGKKIGKYIFQTKKNLIELGQTWRNRVILDFPKVDFTIVVHQDYGEWFLDTYNYPIVIKNGIYL